MTSTFRNAVMKQCISLIAAVWLVCLVRHASAESVIPIKTAEMTGKGAVLTNIPQELKWPSSQPKEYKVLLGKEYTYITKSGVLKVKKQMDRETLCIDNREHCIMDIQVAAWPVNRREPMQYVIINIEVLDINDNSPAFHNKIIEKSISEAVKVGTGIRLDSAVDPDYGANSIQDYRLVSEVGSDMINEYFELATIINFDGTKIPELKLKRSLDRETKGVHELQLEAYDGGTPPRTGRATVRINITDSNDNTPKFEETSIRVKVDEHAKRGTEVVKVHATDEDTGENGRIVYTFPSIVGDRDRKIFSLDSNTGLIVIKNSAMLDYETKKIHQLTVEAKDMGANAVSVYATVSVHVQDVNDNKPEFTVSFLVEPPKNSEFDPIIMENTKVGESLAFVTVRDKDAGINGTVTCELQDDSVFILESIDGASSRFVLRTKQDLDREVKDFYELNIVASDKGTPPQSSTKTIRLKVGDINDNPPKFSYSELAVKVSETAKNGDIIMTLKATDRDEAPGPNSNITYSFLRQRDHVVKEGRSILLTDIFELNPTTGQLMLKIPDVLDAETERTPGSLLVLAKDNGKPSLNTTTKLQVTVIDENDNAPKFTNRSYIFRVDEHVTEGKFVGQVQATDDDFSKDTNGKVLYSMERSRSSDRTISPEDSDMWLKMFQVGSTSGYIHFFGNSSKLDREVYSDRPIVLTVVATDNGYDRQRAEATVEIFLDDINDNKPVVWHPDGRQDVIFVQIIPQRPQPMANSDRNALTNPSRTSTSDSSRKWASTITVKEGTNVTGGDISSVSLLQIQATDKDEGQNSILSYSISAGNDNEYFDVDAKHGNVTFTNNVDMEEMKLGCHILKVDVSDFGSPKLHTNAYVNLYLSESPSTSVNATKAMKECQKNPLFPKPDEGISGQTAIAGLTLYLIIGFAALIFIILLIIAIVLIKCCCCAKRKKSRSYNCQEGSGYNTSSGYDVDSKKSIRKRGSGKRSYNGHGTVDSRSSFHSEWTASQSQLPPDKADKVRVLPDLQSVGSAESRNAHDSGTGDSVSGEAYHHTNYNDVGDGHNYMPARDAQFMQPHRNMSPMKYSDQVVDLPPQHMVQYGDPNMYGRAMISPKCTSECLHYGHGDHCWMPDSLLRSQAQGPIEIMSGGNPDRVVYQNHPDAHALRYHGDTSTPYYYDPGKKFSHLSSTEGSDQLSYSKGLEDGYRHPMDTLSHQGYPINVMHAPSPHPLQQRMYQNEAERERAYINLQGYDPQPNQPDEMHSNLSSTSSNNNPYGAGLPQNHPRVANHPQMFYQVPNMQNSRYDTVYHPGMHDQGPMQPVYKEDYSASNLLPSGTGIPVEYNPHWDHGMSVPMEQQPLINRSEYMPSRSGRTSNPVFDERAKFSVLPPEGSNFNLEEEGSNQQPLLSDDKLTTIQERQAVARSDSLPL